MSRRHCRPRQGQAMVYRPAKEKAAQAMSSSMGCLSCSQGGHFVQETATEPHGLLPQSQDSQKPGSSSTTHER